MNGGANSSLFLSKSGKPPIDSLDYLDDLLDDEENSVSGSESNNDDNHSTSDIEVNINNIALKW